MKIADCLYAYPWRGNDNNCNTYVFAGVLSEGRHVLVDPGHLLTPMYQEPALRHLLSDMSRDGLNGMRTGLVILTHGHPDHCEAAVALRREYGALVAMHEADAGSFEAMGGKVDIFLEEGTLEFNGDRPVSLQIYHSPGHTPGHVTIFWPERKALITGDCVFYRSMGRTDFPGGDAAALQNSIDRLARLDVECLLCGHAYGHPGILKGKEAVRENFRVIQEYFRSGAV